MISRMELGLGAGVPLADWIALGRALDVDLFALGASPAPFGQAAVLDAAVDGGWSVVAEGRSIGVGFECLVLDRAPHRVPGPFRPRLSVGERLAVLLVDVVPNVTDVLDASAEVRSAACRDLPDGWTVGELVAVRRTASNRRRLTEDGGLVDRQFPESGSRWLGALRHPDHPLPPGRGLVWVHARGTHLYPTRLRLRKA
jgi:hypothetical protein